MKFFSLFILLSQPLWMLAQQKSFDIEGRIGNLNPPAKVYLNYASATGQVSQTADVVNGTFSFKGTVTEPVEAMLVLDRTGGAGHAMNNASIEFRPFYLYNETVTFASKDSLKYVVITGSAINEEANKYNAYVNRHLTDYYAFENELAATPPEKQNDSSFQRTLKERKKVILDGEIATLKGYVVQNPTSFFGLTALINLVQLKADPASLDSLYQSISPDLRNTMRGHQLAKVIVALRAAAIGGSAPLFTQPDTSGKPIGLGDYRGKYTLVDFWASWCGPCRAENGNVVRVYREYHPRGLEIIGVSLDDAKEAWLTGIRQDGLLWTQVSDLKGGNNEAALLYAVTEIPKNFLLDPQGKIIATNLRGDDLEKKIAEIFTH